MGKCGAFLVPILLVLLPASTLQSNSTERHARTVGLFQVVNFPNAPCRGTNNLNGTCLSASECVGTGGQAMGSCAQSFGTCCFYSISTCGGTVTKNQTYLQNPNYPATYTVSAATTCTYTFNRINDDVCQLRLDFDKFDLGPPLYPAATNFECVSGNTDIVTFTAGGGLASKFNLCGYNPGQHVYIDMGTPSASPNTVTMAMAFDATNWATYERQYNIMASQIECNSNYHAPKGCDQYFFGNGGAGVIQAFNYDQATLANQARLTGYLSMCVRREEGRCKIGYTPPNYDSDNSGFAMNGNANGKTGRVSCLHPSPNPPSNNICKHSYVRIPQGTSNGDAPFYSSNPPAIGCDRFCAKRLCGTAGMCTGGHQTIYSKTIPFQLHLESDSHSKSNTGNKGYKLNYFQLPC